MRFIIDTSTYIWYLNGSEKLSKIAFDIIENKNNNIFISIASIWELSIKVKLGKLKLISDIYTLEDDLYRYKITILPITITDIHKNYKLPFHHRDPFDRMIISQSLVSGMPIIACDELFDSYLVNRIW
jgi:PIN domain nuclease of toxin-antitoxin system